MKLKEIGEFGFINRFAPKFQKLVPEGDSGIGDDCALIAISEEDYHLISTDLLIEDIHFLKDKITPEELGYKALAVNLSDIAAMGGKALYSFLSIGIPKDIDVKYLDRFMAGYYQLSEKYHVPLMGGDTTSSADRLVINVGVIGQSQKGDVKLRSMAQTGDVICVSGPLGDSAGGLKILLEKRPLDADNKALVKRHHQPEPMLNEGLWLAQHTSVHAMMDISDGISSDLKHILKLSHKSAIIDVDKIPVSPLLHRVAKKHNWDSTALAISGGEDYELLFTVSAKDYEKLSQDFKADFDKPLHAIGTITENKNSIAWHIKGQKISPHEIGFDHFK